MAAIDLIKHHSGFLLPSLPKDKEALDKWINGEILRAEVSKKRNAKFHRKAFALINVIYEAQDRYTNREHLLTDIKCRTGHYHEFISSLGELFYIPDSISFAKCDQLEFEQWYSKVIDVALETYMPHWSREEIELHANRIVGFL